MRSYIFKKLARRYLLESKCISGRLNLILRLKKESLANYILPYFVTSGRKENAVAFDKVILQRNLHL